jgi:DNA-binding CsgD family transcriptional regulator
VVVVEGPAGIGKSRLLAAACEEAGRAGMRVLRARGAELEREVSFGVAVELLKAPVARAGRVERERLVAGQAALERLLLEPSAEVTAEPPALIRGLYRVAVGASARRPLVIVVDDAHWADRPSLAFLAHLAVRTGELPIVVLLAIRDDERGVAENVPAALRHGPATVHVAPGALSEAAVREILAEELGGGEPAFVSACFHATAGNPFLTWELARALRVDGVDPTAAAAERVGELVPASVLHSVLSRLGRLGEDAQRVAEAAAVLGDGALLRQVTALADMGAMAAERGADELARASILAAGEPLRFAHPLIAAAVHSDMAAFARARAHRRAAGVLQAESAPVHEVAAHLALSTPEGAPDTVAILRGAAARAVSLGDPAAAARLLARAAAEPPPPADRGAVVLELARAEMLAGDPACKRHATEALERAGDDAMARAQALRVLSQVCVAQGQPIEAASALREALATVSVAEPAGQEILAEYLTAHRFTTSLFSAARTRLARIVTAARDGRMPSHPGLAAHVVLELAFAGERPDVVVALAQRTSATEAVVDPGAHGMYMGLLVQALCCIDELDTAQRLADAALNAARDKGSFMGVAAGSFHRAIASYQRGALRDALVDLEQAQAPYREGWLAAAPWPQALEAHVRLERGELDAAAAAVRLIWSAPPAPGTMTHAIALYARARMALAQHDGRAAMVDAEAAGRELVEGFGVDHPGFIPWRCTAALAALALDDRARARTLAQDALERARWSNVARAIGLALRTVAATSHGSQKVALLTEAAGALQCSPSRLERAHVLSELGRALLRAGHRHDAQRPLREALALADGMGAIPLAQAARTDLHAAGARPRRAALTGVDALTPAELRVCRLAARGATNRQIADELVVSAKTVQTHLSHAYQKLEIVSRRELPDALAMAQRP